jgi:hypothetical protein
MRRTDLPLAYLRFPPLRTYISIHEGKRAPRGGCRQVHSSLLERSGRVSRTILDRGEAKGHGGDAKKTLAGEQ